jgi:hypothetical protein
MGVRMADEKADQGKAHGGFLGSLRDALAAASRDDPSKLPLRMPGSSPVVPSAAMTPPPLPQAAPAPAEPQPHTPAQSPPPLPSAAEAARQARGGTPHIPALDRALERHVDADAAPTTKVIRGLPPAPKAPPEEDIARTQLVRGKPQVQRGNFATDPVVGWLVVVGGPGLGSFRPVFEGNNTLGRNSSQRVPIDFGDEAISSEEQAYIRYDSSERSFLFVPNLAKTNVVQVNSKRPTSAVPLNAMDVIIMGRTQLVFVPFCGADFDWAELAEIKG